MAEVMSQLISCLQGIGTLARVGVLDADIVRRGGPWSCRRGGIAGPMLRICLEFVGGRLVRRWVVCGPVSSG